MRLELNQVFSADQVSEFEPWEILTRGRHQKPLNRFKGMPYFAECRGITPLINFHSNPFKEDSNQTPWRDLIFQEEGSVIYNGDNYQHSKEAASTFGNKLVLSILNLYVSLDIEDRFKAPPILVTRTVEYKGKTGFREFIGFGIITSSPKLVQQYEKSSKKVFSNYQFDVTLFKLDDGEKFNWEWIDDRRDDAISINESLKIIRS
jgi:hypothetical protein